MEVALGKMASFLEAQLGKGDRRTEKRKVTVAEARKMLEDIEVESVMSQETVIREAINAVEQDGIVFIDEIDKIVTSSGYRYGARLLTMLTMMLTIMLTIMVTIMVTTTMLHHVRRGCQQRGRAA